jgi:hypothetical protein
MAAGLQLNQVFQLKGMTEFLSISLTWAEAAWQVQQNGFRADFHR